MQFAKEKNSQNQCLSLSFSLSPLLRRRTERRDCSGARGSFRFWLLLGYFPSVRKRRLVMLLGVLLQHRSPNSTPRTNTTPRGPPTVPLAVLPVCKESRRSLRHPDHIRRRVESDRRGRSGREGEPARMNGAMRGGCATPPPWGAALQTVWGQG